MKYRKYLATAFIAALFLPLLSAKSAEVTKEELDLGSVNYIEFELEEGLGFDTAKYLPEGFNPYSDVISVESVNFVEDDTVELGFDTSDYLPEDFNPYQK